MLAGVLLLAAVGCTTRQGTDIDARPPTVTVTPVPQPQQNSQALLVQISNGHFDHAVYEEQPGATRLIVKTQGGPYLFYIGGLVDRRELRANGETQVQYDVSTPGRYTLHANLTTKTSADAKQATAVLDVRPPGER